MYGQKISFVGRFGLQATFISFVTISIVLTLAKSGLPGEGQDIAIKIAILFCLQRHGVGRREGKQRNREQRGVTPECFHNGCGTHTYTEYYLLNHKKARQVGLPGGRDDLFSVWRTY